MRRDSLQTAPAMSLASRIVHTHPATKRITNHEQADMSPHNVQVAVERHSLPSQLITSCHFGQSKLDLDV